MKKRIIILGAIFLVCVSGIVFYQYNKKTTVISNIKPLITAKKIQKKAVKTPKIVAAKKNIERKKAQKVDTSKWLTSNTEISFPILMYHSLSSGNSLRVPPAEFEGHLKWLKDNGYYTLTPEEAYHVLAENKKPAEKIVWIVLDDGYRDNFQAGFPILKKLNMKATICYITGNAPLQNFTQLNELQEMSDSRLVSIQSHTVHHQELSLMTDAQQLNEMTESKKWLDENLHQKTSVLCYPVGRFNQQTAALAEKSGYKLALTTQPGLAKKSQGLMNLHRVRITPNMDGEHFGQVILYAQ